LGTTNFDKAFEAVNESVGTDDSVLEIIPNTETRTITIKTAPTVIADNTKINALMEKAPKVKKGINIKVV